jgi:hypothetical protein
MCKAEAPGSHAPPVAALCSDAKVANRDVRDFGWGIAHAAVSRRPPISLYTMVPRTGATRTTLGLGLCASFKGHPLPRRAEPNRYDSQPFHRCTPWGPARACVSSPTLGAKTPLLFPTRGLSARTCRRRSSTSGDDSATAGSTRGPRARGGARVLCWASRLRCGSEQRAPPPSRCWVRWRGEATGTGPRARRPGGAGGSCGTCTRRRRVR